eukprot:GHVQ01019007.1.p1 GENE.GHVQ01019007.1~~GHVQ01019007.1.p1  ORF type:complete len:130 (+),score=8.88 GHVQ01019007.1:759-1148(+)
MGGELIFCRAFPEHVCVYVHGGGCVPCFCNACTLFIWMSVSMWTLFPCVCDTSTFVSVCRCVSETCFHYACTYAVSVGVFLYALWLMLLGERCAVFVLCTSLPVNVAPAVWPYNQAEQLKLFSFSEAGL